tara:strand:- start:280 stop:879 length:600 start_codon:yes stop_codon:yes gene_type:complete
MLKLLHPFTPFITEELWKNFKPENAGDLIVSEWPKSYFYRNDEIESEINNLKEIITSIRSVRSRMNIPNSKKIELIINCNDKKKDFLFSYLELFKHFTKVESLSISSSNIKPSNSATVVSLGIEFHIPLVGLVDLDKEKKRIIKRLSEIEKLLNSINGKLSNQNFLDRAPKDVILRERSNHKILKEEDEKLRANLEIFK